MSTAVHIDVFEGPLDLLLRLVKVNDLNIFDIPISQITTEYLGYVDLMRELKLDVAGDFLVMASTLMQIKAKALLPAPVADGNEGPDPKAQLIDRLYEYQRFKEAARTLETRLQVTKDIHYRGAPLFGEGDFQMEASLFDLLDAFRDVLKNLKPEVREIVYEEIPIEVKIREILSFLEGKTFSTFREILRRETTRRGLIVTFLAVLELIRLHQIVARQAQAFGDIRVYKTEAAPAEAESQDVEEPEPSLASPLPEE